ncbi:MAG: sodium:calcium antiporter, partial [Candidatus Omnitrophica bacterium]|nr:sodium:calcium antiporter [Candidatus Omnitrophota bacterium]
MVILWLKFIVCVTVILYCGKGVARYGDAIAEKTGLSGLWIGVILVSLATSLPELFTGVGSTVFLDAPNLTVGNLFGANIYNLINIAILDFLNKGAPLLSVISTGQLLTATLSLVPLSIAALGIFLSPKLTEISFANVSLYSILILITYFVSTRIIFKFEKNQQRILQEIRKEEKILYKYDAISLPQASIYYAIFALMIACAGIWLAYIGDDLSKLLGLGQNFVGSLFLGFATTLPEMTVSIAAIRLGAKELAVANMLGSNLFNMAIIFMNDVLYRKGPIFAVLSQQHVFVAFIVMLMTVTVIAGL